MKKFLLLTIASLTFSVSAVAQVSCETLRDEIATKIMNNGVPESGFKLDIVPVDQVAQTGGQVVGGCGGGTNSIVYTRFRNGEGNANAPMVNQNEQQTSQSATTTQPTDAQQTAPAQTGTVTGESLTKEVDTFTEAPGPATTIDGTGAQ